MTLNLERIPSGEAEQGQESALDHIRALYRNAERERRLKVPVPGEMGRYVRLRYRPRDDFERQDGVTGREANLDYLIHLCDAILVKTAAGWEPLTDQAGEPVLFYPDELRELLGLKVPSLDDGGQARDVLLALFAGAPLPHAAVADHVLQVNEWMQTGQARVDQEEILGES